MFFDANDQKIDEGDTLASVREPDYFVTVSHIDDVRVFVVFGEKKHHGFLLFAGDWIVVRKGKVGIS